MLGFIAKSCSQINRKICFSSLNISGIVTVNIEVGTKTRVISLSADILTQCMVRFYMIYIYVMGRRSDITNKLTTTSIYIQS